MDKIEILNRLTGSDQLEKMDALKRDLEEMSTEVMKKHLGPVPEYNGVVGDSCDCPSCCYRRKIEGIDITYDMEHGKQEPMQSLINVVKGYSKIGKPVPETASIDAFNERAKVFIKTKGDELKAEMLKTGHDVLEMSPEIRDKMVERDAPAPVLKAFDRAMELLGHNDPDEMPEGMKRELVVNLIKVALWTKANT